MDPILSALDTQMSEIRKRRDELKATQDNMVAKAATENRSNLTDDESAEFLKVTAERNDLAARETAVMDQHAARTEELRRDAVAVANLPKQYTHESRAVVTAEERTYTPEKDRRGANDGGTSYFRDMFLYTTQADIGARARLERHMAEVQRERELGAREERAVASSGFAGLVVPQYLTQLAALIARNGRPFANALTRLELPDQGMSLIIPRGTTGASEASPTAENQSVSSTDEVWANLTVSVVTIAGQQDVSRQSIERGIPGLDGLIYRDLAGAYAAELDRQTIAGATGSAQSQGIQFAGGTQATAYTAAATASTFYTKLAGGINSIESAGTVVAPANLILMHPRRFSWLLGQVDSQGRPLVTPVANGIQNFNSLGVDTAPGAYSGNPQAASTQVDFNGFTIKGYIQGLPVITDANVPTAVGTGPEDLVFVVNTMHLLLWENGDGMPNQLRFEQTLGNQLTVKLIAYNYSAFTGARYPAAVSILGGNAGTIGFGQVAPTF